MKSIHFILCGLVITGAISCKKYLEIVPKGQKIPQEFLKIIKRWWKMPKRILSITIIRTK